MTSVDRPLRVFLCHSSKDKPAVRELYEKLTARGIDAWLDEKKLLPGQYWKTEIPKAVREADVVVVCLSKSSITKEGYVQREIKYALDFALEKPENTIYLIPARLEECKVPDSLGDWQWVNLFDRQGIELIFASLQLRANSLGLKIEVAERLHENKIMFPNGMEFMYVPAGNFLMGMAESIRTIDIPYDYWVARYPVTNELYNAYIEYKNSSHPVPDWGNKRDYPVVNVSLNDAMEYCQWLNNLNHDKLPSKSILRLPTEEEWEKAARGRDDRLYPWGDNFNKNYCNTKEGEKDKITPVGMYSPKGDSPYGCADMAGNIWEWTCSFRKKIYSDEEPIPVIRGGSWEFDKRSAYVSHRDIIPWVKEDSSVGFRVCLAPPLPK